MALDRSTPDGYADRVGQDALSITPSDTVDTTVLCRALYVGGVGDVSLVTLSGNTVVFKAVPAGTVLPVGFRRINFTDTTATLLVGIV